MPSLNLAGDLASLPPLKFWWCEILDGIYSTLFSLAKYAIAMKKA